MSASPAIDAERSSSTVGFGGEIVAEEIEGREFNTVIVFEFTVAPKSSPSLGVTEDCQLSPFRRDVLEIVINPSNCD